MSHSVSSLSVAAFSERCENTTDGDGGGGGGAGAGGRVDGGRGGRRGRGAELQR